MIVYSTLASPPNIDRSAQEAGLAGVVAVRKVERSLADLTKDLESLAPHAWPGNFWAELDVQSNAVRVATASPSSLQAYAQDSGLRLPPSARVETDPRQIRRVDSIYAGLALYQGATFVCTSGFTVAKSQFPFTQGITTAAHCPNALRFNQVDLPFQAAVFGGSTDAQWHTVGTHTPKPWAHDGIVGGSTSRYRIITSDTHRDNQALNTLVCKYGISTNYDCGYLVSKTVVGAVPNPAATWMHLHRDGVDMSSPGDSGGPIFVSASAWGIMHACISVDLECDNPALKDDAVYDAINYVEANLGLNILHG